MNQHQKVAIATIRDLSGAPLSILLTMFILRRPVSKKILSTSLRIAYNTTSDAIDFLELNGYIQRDDYRTWSLPNHGQLPLPGFETAIQHPPVSPSIPATTSAPDSRPAPQIEAGSARDNTQPASTNAPQPRERTNGTVVHQTGPKTAKHQKLTFQTSNFDVSPTTTTVSSNIDTPKKVVGSSNQTETSKNDVSDELEQAFQSAGIGQNVWPELSRYPWVDAAYIRAQTARIRGHPDPAKRNTGFLICCIRAHDPAPETCEHCGAILGDGCQHNDGCPHTSPYAKYLGKYADQVMS